VPLPRIEDAEDARLLIATILADERIDALRAIFSSEVGRLGDHLAGVRARADSAQLSALAAAWDREAVVPAPTRTTEALRADAARWDFRLGRERDSIPTDPDLLPPDVAALVLEVADDWGLTERPDPPSDHYDAVVPIGGLVRANVGRPATVAAWLRAGLSTAAVLGIGGVRATSAAERETAERLGLPGDSEQSALRRGLELAFDLDPHGWTTRRPGLDLTMSPTGLPILLGVAPLNADGSRVNTGQAMTWALDQVDLLSDGRVLQVTTSIYWIANQIDTRIALPRQVTLHTRGYDTGLVPGATPTFQPQHYLQEIKAAVDALPRLQAWAEQPSLP
jgi:8-oxo-dGTP pyrophosphatase MutT (NUDIX family)